MLSRFILDLEQSEGCNGFYNHKYFYYFLFFVNSFLLLKIAPIFTNVSIFRYHVFLWEMEGVEGLWKCQILYVFKNVRKIIKNDRGLSTL